MPAQQPPAKQPQPKQPQPEHHCVIAVPATARYGQAPTWDAATDTLLWVDTPSRLVHRFVPGDENNSMEVPHAVSAAKPRSHGGLVLHLADGIALFEANQQQRTWLVYWARESFHGGATAVDPAGRLWAASASSSTQQHGGGAGWLAMIEPNGSAHVALHGIAAGAGIAFSPDHTLLYWVEGPAGSIEVFDFDVTTGELSGRRRLCSVDQADGEPAGICVDSDGYLWVAVRHGGEVRRYTPHGTLERSVALPARQPTACCFGGPQLGDLYVTTARDGTDTEESEESDTAEGALLVLPGIGEGLRTPAFAG